jgi:hypothetical protein
MYTSSAGRRTKIQSTYSEKSIAQDTHKEKKKCPTPRSSLFNMDSLIAPLAEGKSTKPFKFISFDNSAVSPRHRRQPSVIIKNVSQVYNFTNGQGFSSDKVSDEESITEFAHKQKNSIFASTTDRKSSVYNSIIKKSTLDEEFYKNEYSETVENFEGITKPDENYTTIGLSTQEEGHETPLGILPKKLYCKKCNMDTTSVVSLKMPTLPFWKVMCCIGSITETCSDFENVKYQEYQHRCRKCKMIIASAQPI